MLSLSRGSLWWVCVLILAVTLVCAASAHARAVTEDATSSVSDSQLPTLTHIYAAAPYNSINNRKLAEDTKDRVVLKLEGERTDNWRDRILYITPDNLRDVSPITQPNTLTLGIKSFGRSATVKRLVDSIAMHEEYKNVRVLIADDGSAGTEAMSVIEPMVAQYPNVHYALLPFDTGLSGGRNFLLDRCTTEFIAILDDDFIMLPKSNLGYLQQILVDTPGVHLAAGMITERPGVYGRFVPVAGGLAIVPTDVGLLSVESQCIFVEFVANFFVGRTRSLRQVRWDDNLPLGEHEDFLYRYKNAGFVTVYCPRVKIGHVQVEASSVTVGTKDEAYAVYRARAGMFLRKSMEKHGLTFLAYSTIDGSRWNCLPRDISEDAVDVCTRVQPYLERYLRPQATSPSMLSSTPSWAVPCATSGFLLVIGVVVLLVFVGERRRAMLLREARSVLQRCHKVVTSQSSSNVRV